MRFWAVICRVAQKGPGTETWVKPWKSSGTATGYSHSPLMTAASKMSHDHGVRSGGIWNHIAILGGTALGSQEVSVAVKIEPETRERIKRLAERRQRTQHSLMRDAIRQYVEREEARDAFLQQARDAWQEYRETGLHASGEEVLEWLATWGGESETLAPVCHD